MGVPERGVGSEVLVAAGVVGLPLPTKARDRGGMDGEGAPDCGDDLLHAPHHERGVGRAELKERHNPEDGVRVSQPGALQDRSTVPVRWTTALPGHPRKCRMNPNS